MAAYDIKLDNGWIDTVLCATSLKDALERHSSERIRMGYTSTNVIAVRKMNESYGNGGYGLIASEEWHTISPST